jgi:AH receptor-interacting protein
MMSSQESSSKPIEKKIIHAGKTPTDNIFKDGTKVKFHFVTKKGDQVLDDSRKWDKDGPMEVIFGKKFKFEVWELCLSTMTVGEVASFKVKKKV